MSTKIIDHGDIPVDLIAPNPEQPRQQLDPASLEELAQSIRERGVIQPIVVELAPEPTAACRYILHTGERRWRAAKLAGLATIPAIVVNESTPVDRLVRALVENIQRQDMSPLDVARAFARMHDELGMSDQRIADQVGKSRSTIANARRLLDLPEPAQKLADQGVSERTLAALLPLYNLPEDLLQKAEADPQGYSKPSTLIREIQTGEIGSSDLVRRRVSQIMYNHSQRLAQSGFPLDYEFDANGLKVRSPRCDKCPVRILDGDNSLCPDAACFEAKGHRWRTETLSGASEASGIPLLQGNLVYNDVESFYGNGNLVKQIIVAGCENLRLQYDKYAGTHEERHVPGYPQAAIVCHHGKGKHCTCLSKLRSERTRNDPLQIAERERKKDLQKMLAEYSAILAAAIADANPAVWLRILQSMSYKYSDKGEGWPIETTREKMAQVLIDVKLPYDPHQRIDVARQAVDKFFSELALPLPGRDDPAVDIKRRFERIQGWIAAVDRNQVTLEQVQGNLANLEKITDEFDQVSHQHIDKQAFDGFLQALAEAWETLTELKRELNGRVGAQTPTQYAVRNTQEDSHV